MEYTYIHNHQSQFLEMFGNLDKTERLCDHCQVISGKSMSVKEEESSGPISYIKVADFNLAGNDKFIATSSRYVSVESASKSKMIQKGCVVFAKNGAASLSNKKRLTAIECCIDMNTMAVKINDDSLSSEYLYFFLCSIDIKDHIRQGAIPSIDPHSVESILLPLPPMDQQKTFVTIAEQADKSKFDGFKSQFLEWFGSPVSNPKGWQVVPLKEASILVSDGPFGSNLKSCHYVNHGIRVIRLQNIGVGFFDDRDKAFISESHYNVLKKYTCKPGEVVIGTLGEPNLRACIVPDYIDTSINKADCIHVIPDETKLLPQFVCSYINCEETLYIATSQIHGTTRNRISGGQVSQLPIYLPQIELQKQFISVAEQADKSKYYEINET